MECQHCHQERPDGANYCPACGKPVNTAPRRPLARSRSNRMIAGVCAGLADYFAIDVSLVRLAWVILSIVPGGVIGGIVVYVLAWLIMPEPSAAGVAAVSSRSDRLTRSASNRKLGGVCGGLGEYFALDPTAVRVVWLVLSILPGAIVGGLVAYILAWIVIPPPGAGVGFVSSPVPPPPSAI